MSVIKTAILLIIALLYILSISLVHATLIKDTWDFQVKYATGSYLNKSINDTFSIDFTYDNEGQIMNEYLADGSIIKNCNNTSITDCDNTWRFYSLMSDTSMSDISFLFNGSALSKNGGALFHKNVDKKHWRFQTDSNIAPVTSSERVAVVDGWFDIYLTDFLPTHMSDVAQFTFHYKNKFGGYNTSQYKAHIKGRTSSVVSVPEPTTLAIFLVGLMALLFRRVS